jgi:NADPH-dependent 7-cyano-7-deazaguanine reductase QueF
MNNLPWQAYIPIDNLKEYEPIKSKSVSYRSNVFHEKKLNEIVENYINNLGIRKKYN